MLNKREAFAIVFILAFALLGGILRQAKKPMTERTPTLREASFSESADTVRVAESVTLPAVLKVNLNHATLEELVKLDGIGEKTARQIILFRERHGGFKAVGELLKVRGVGPKKFERLALHIEI